jgi:hypothetical protein
LSLSNQTYNTLKWIAQILLPALATLYLALAGLWGFPHTEAVVGTITAVDTFLGALLGLASKNYEPKVDGVLHVDHKNQEVYAALETPAEDMTEKDTATLKVSEVA